MFLMLKQYRDRRLKSPCVYSFSYPNLTNFLSFQTHYLSLLELPISLMAALGGLAALLALFDKCYQEAAVSAIVAFLLSPYGAPQVLFWLGRKLLELAGCLYDLYY